MIEVFFAVLNLRCFFEQEQYDNIASGYYEWPRKIVSR